MPLPPPLLQIVEWLRAGYPEGVPEQDYQPLLALLSKQLTPTAPADEADVERVRRHLESVGWTPDKP